MLQDFPYLFKLLSKDKGLCTFFDGRLHMYMCTFQPQKFDLKFVAIYNFTAVTVLGLMCMLWSYFLFGWKDLSNIKVVETQGLMEYFFSLQYSQEKDRMFKSYTACIFLLFILIFIIQITTLPRYVLCVPKTAFIIVISLLCVYDVAKHLAWISAVSSESLTHDKTYQMSFWEWYSERRLKFRQLNPVKLTDL